MLLNRDCLSALKELEPDKIDALITDPPAGISFMGKAWDKGNDFIPIMTEIYRECLRVMKPGAHGLVWALPRTSHWTATALEAAGFEIRDVVTHLFGSGFPKSLDISKAIDKAAGAERKIIGKADYSSQDIRGNAYDSEEAKERDRLPVLITAPATDDAKQWQGWGTALKPASEHWILIRKPISEDTIAKNVLKHGVGGINIDGGRIEATSEKDLREIQSERPSTSKGQFAALTKDDKLDRSDRSHITGRFPANLILDEVAAEMLDEQAGPRKSGNIKAGTMQGFGGGANCFGEGKVPSEYIGDAGKNASRFFYCAKTSKRERNEGLEGLPEIVCTSKTQNSFGRMENNIISNARPSNPKNQNHHPTVKPQKLMEYLITLITPPGGLILDPFMGSGSTGVAAKNLGFNFIGIEREEDYFEIAQKRILNSGQ